MSGVGYSRTTGICLTNFLHTISTTSEGGIKFTENETLINLCFVKQLMVTFD